MTQATTQAMTGFFKTRDQGEAALEALLAAGFSRQEVGFLAGALHPHETPVIGPALRFTGSQSEAAGDTWVGAVVGFTAGCVAALPDVGLVAMGPLAGMFGGLAVGSLMGGLLGLLRDHGISQEEAEFYAQGVRDGGSLVTVHGVSELRAKEARKILDHQGAIRVESLNDETPAGTHPASYNTCGEESDSA